MTKLKLLQMQLLMLLLTLTNVARASSNSPMLSGNSTKGASSDVVYIGINFAPVITQNNDSIRAMGGSFPGEGPANTSSVFGYDTRMTVGGILYNHFLIGFSYNILSEVTHRNSSPTGDTTRNADLEQREFGPTLGILLGHWQLKFTWITWSKKVDEDSEANADGSPAVNSITKNYDGHGWELEFGYAFEIFHGFFIGPNLIYRRVQYGLQSFTDNLTPGNSYYGKGFSDQADEGTIDPMILFLVKF
jgi:hypothetical protein